MLLYYINSVGVLAAIGQTNVNHILNFLRDHIFVHEEFFAAYRYNQHRTFLDYSNTPLEGTNGGLKYGRCSIFCLLYTGYPLFGS